MLGKAQHIHFVGIGGAGMSAMAEVVRDMGHRVSGSDHKPSPTTERLVSVGIEVQFDHEPRLCAGADLMVYSSAVHPDNPERLYAERQGIHTMRRAEMLGDLMRGRTSIGVAGTHGKTTTTSLLAQVLRVAGKDPVVIVGGTLRHEGAGAILGRGNLLVAEADEYDRSFLSMHPTVAVVTNVDADHLDCYHDLDEIRQAFVRYANSVPFYGAVIACIDDPGVREIAPQLNRHVVTYGRADDAQYRIDKVSFGSGMARFTVLAGETALGEVELPMAGMHNVLNATAAAAVATEMGIPFATVRDALGSFGGVKRRFELIGEVRGVRVYDDYAHHPREVAATLDDAAHRGFARTIAVFQPHLYSRTRTFLDEFASSLASADIVLVTGIYRAREDIDTTVHASEIVARLQEKGHGDARYVDSKDDIAATLLPELRRGDAVLLLGAGDVWKVANTLLEGLANG